jgi:Protein of unknown function (DUF3485)
MPERSKAAPGPAMVAAYAAGFALLVASGLVRGHLTGRWGASGELASAVARLGRVPTSIGEWEGRDVPMDPRQIDRAGIQGYLSRSYRNARDGREVTILLVCGLPGPIAVHTPDICYRGAGYESDSDPVAAAPGPAGAAPGRFLGARFRKAGAAVPETLDILWAWNAGAAWEAPGQPRAAFAGRPWLYKAYQITRRDETATGTTAGGLAPVAPIFEAIDRALFARRDPTGVTPPR